MYLGKENKYLHAIRHDSIVLFYVVIFWKVNFLAVKDFDNISIAGI